MKNYGVLDVTFLFLRLYNITNLQNTPQASRLKAQDSQDLAIDVCSLPSQRGSCDRNFKRYYFHSSSGRCFLFMYSGCGENQNNFLSEEECQQRCGKNEARDPRKLEINVCGLKPDKGPCEANYRRYFFNRTNGQCVLFMYSGCGGNMNNFLSKELCQQQCFRNEVPIQVPQEVEINICDSAPERGLCKGYKLRYFFNRTKGKCMLFDYGGCGGNMNNFISEELCVQRCGRNEVTEGSLQKLDMCGFPPDTGPCQSNSRRYFFDKTVGKCVLFAYGVCGGKLNNFNSEERCIQTCIRDEVTTPSLQEAEIDICDLPEKKGNCNNSSQRYRFDMLSSECVLFTYSGCGGNQNNFMSEDECQQRCEDNEDTEICGENEEYDSCGTACPLTCENYQQPPEICTLQCVIGCRCQEGFVKTADKRCVRTEQCTTSVPVLATKAPQTVRTTSTQGIRTVYDQAVPSIVVRKQVVPSIAVRKQVVPGIAVRKQVVHSIAVRHPVVHGIAIQFGRRLSVKDVRATTALPLPTFPTETPIILYGNEPCTLDKSVGPCKYTISRFYYSKSSGACELFNYGGCGGNANNFISKEYCELICIAQNKD